MQTAILVDFGSTYTKVIGVDLTAARLLATAQAPSSVETDVTTGLHQALRRLGEQGVQTRDPSLVLGCSSAAGGLRMVAVGLVPSLTVEAARRAALGAGAKVIKVYGYQLSRTEVAELKALAPDVILLAGGTDGGDRATILANAGSIAAAGITAPVVVAGNKSVGPEIAEILQGTGIDARLTENVLPELDRLNVEPARHQIRELFIERIVEAKGLERARALVEEIIMPTPMAVLRATQLLADGPPGGAGLGEALVVDVGGATTDVHTVAVGAPTAAGAVLKGLPEPRVKRTVEGDLGIRINARSVFEAGEAAGLLPGRAAAPVAAIEQPASEEPAPVTPAALAAAAERLAADTAATPVSDADFAIDAALAAIAVTVATDRHAGVLEEAWTAHGKAFVQYGKDLRPLQAVVGTGGIFAFGRHPRQVLAAATRGDPLRLKPLRPRFWVDRRYILYGMGLLAEQHPDVAYRVLTENLQEV